MWDSHPLQLWSPRSRGAQGSAVPSSLPSATGTGPCLCQLPGSSLLSPLTTAAGMLLVASAPSTRTTGCGLIGVSHPSSWVSGRYPSSHARSGCAETVMPIAAKGALHPSGMGDVSKSCVRGGIGTDCAHTYVYHPLTPLRCLAHPSSLHPPLSLTHALGMVTAAHAHIRCVNAAHGWLR